MRNFFNPSTNPIALKQILQIQARLAGLLNREFMPVMFCLAASCPKPQQTNPPTKKKNKKQTNKLRSNNEKPHCIHFIALSIILRSLSLCIFTKISWSTINFKTENGSRLITEYYVFAIHVDEFNFLREKFGVSAYSQDRLVAE